MEEIKQIASHNPMLVKPYWPSATRCLRSGTTSWPLQWRAVAAGRGPAGHWPSCEDAGDAWHCLAPPPTGGFWCLRWNHSFSRCLQLLVSSGPVPRPDKNMYGWMRYIQQLMPTYLSIWIIKMSSHLIYPEEKKSQNKKHHYRFLHFWFLSLWHYFLEDKIKENQCEKINKWQICKTDKKSNETLLLLTWHLQFCSLHPSSSSFFYLVQRGILRNFTHTHIWIWSLHKQYLA